MTQSAEQTVMTNIAFNDNCKANFIVLFIMPPPHRADALSDTFV